MSSSPRWRSAWLIVSRGAVQRRAGLVQDGAERVAQRGDAVVQRPGAAFRQPVGIQRERGSGRQGDLGDFEGPGAEPQREPGGHGEHLGAAARQRQHGRRVTGGRDHAGAGPGVDHGADAGGVRRGGHTRDHRVQGGQQLGGRQVQAGQEVRRGAQLHHDRRRLRAVPHRVPHDQGHPPAGQGDDVMPVPAHHAGAHRQVQVRDLHGRRDARLGGQQAALEREGGPPFPVIQPGVVDAHRRPRGELARRGDVRGPEVRALRRPPERRAPQDHPLGHQGDGQPRRVAGGEVTAAGTAGDPLGALVVEVVEQDRAPGMHGPEAGRRHPRRPAPHRGAARCR